jgi:hypothetical protein
MPMFLLAPPQDFRRKTNQDSVVLRIFFRRRVQQQQQQQQQQNNGAYNNNNNNNNNTTTTENLIYFLPETYRLGTAADRKAFQTTLHRDTANGHHRPWVLKKTRSSRGRGVEMLPPHLEAQHTAIDRSLADATSNYTILKRRRAAFSPSEAVFP